MLDRQLKKKKKGIHLWSKHCESFPKDVVGSSTISGQVCCGGKERGNDINLKYSVRSSKLPIPVKTSACPLNTDRYIRKYTTQDKSRQDNTSQTRQVRQDKTSQTRQVKTSQVKIRQDKISLVKTNQDKLRHDKTSQGKARHDNRRQLFSVSYLLTWSCNPHSRWLST